MANRRDRLYWLDLLIAAIAGIWTLFHIIWGIAGQTSDDYWGPALIVLFLLALILDTWLANKKHTHYSAKSAQFFRPLLPMCNASLN